MTDEQESNPPPYVPASEQEAYIREQLLKRSLPPWPGYEQLEWMHKYLTTLPIGDAIVMTPRGLLRMTIPERIVNRQVQMTESILYPLPPRSKTKGERQ